MKKFLLFAACAATWIPAFAGMTVVSYAASLPPAQEFQLDNGLKVLVIEDHKIPAVTQMLWYYAGGADEQQGKTGLAHYLEHLMFKATENMQSGDFSRLIAWYGGNDNAFTTQDTTAYHQSIPKERLPLVMLMESERMRGLILDETTAVKERDVILEERSMRVDNRPAALLSEKMNAALFGETHPYGVPVIGWRSDIEKLTHTDAEDFYRRYYAPNNAILVIAGDVTLEEVKELAQKYYGPLQANPEAAPEKRSILSATITSDAPAKPIVLKDGRVEQPEWVRYYLAPSAHPGTTARFAGPLVLAAQILGGGETSYLYQSLVVEQGIATSASAWYDELALGPSSFRIYVTPKPGVTFETIAAAVDSTLASFVEKGPTKQEMSQAKTLLRASAIYTQDNLESIARIYGKVATAGLGTDYVTRWVDDINAITSDDLLAASRHVFTASPRFVTGHLVPEEK